MIDPFKSQEENLIRLGIEDEYLWYDLMVCIAEPFKHNKLSINRILRKNIPQFLETHELVVDKFRPTFRNIK